MKKEEKSQTNVKFIDWNVVKNVSTTSLYFIFGYAFLVH